MNITHSHQPGTTDTYCKSYSLSIEHITGNGHCLLSAYSASNGMTLAEAKKRLKTRFRKYPELHSHIPNARQQLEAYISEEFRDYDQAICDIVPNLLAPIIILEDDDRQHGFTNIIRIKSQDPREQLKPAMVRLTSGGTVGGHYDAIITPQWKPKRQWNNTAPIIRLPFINEKLKRAAERAIKQSPFDINIVWVSGPSLLSKISRSAIQPLVCTKANCITKLSSDRNICFAKNIVYQISCGLCHEVYIGETGRFLHQRVTEHTANVGTASEASEQPLRKHWYENHRGLQFRGEVKILRRCRDAADRKLWESAFITDMKPNINTQKPWMI